MTDEKHGERPPELIYDEVETVTPERLEQLFGVTPTSSVLTREKMERAIHAMANPTREQAEGAIVEQLMADNVVLWRGLKDALALHDTIIARIEARADAEAARADAVTGDPQDELVRFRVLRHLHAFEVLRDLARELREEVGRG